MAFITFLIYTILYEAIVLGGTGYAVFVLGHSAWWLLLGVILSGAQIQPHMWHSLMDGVDRYSKEEK